MLKGLLSRFSQKSKTTEIVKETIVPVPQKIFFLQFDLRELEQVIHSPYPDGKVQIMFILFRNV